ISAGILELLYRKALSATGCFSTAPTWRTDAAPALLERVGTSLQADIGLHFNLTEGFGVQPARSLNGLILRSLAGELSRKATQAVIATALQRQLDAFEAGLGIAPDFVDGHQHVHQFRGVRDVLLQVLEQRYPGSRPWIRNTVPASNKWHGKPR
ncbi:ChbG/HpnK family deacetylase, partial [Leptospira sp. SA-E8]|uniref:ChbG/HpnK family deacetylase n=1 Tax=Leptospira sp. SA-E8 TaxID=3422259 RepID=UPI003EBFFC37